MLKSKHVSVVVMRVASVPLALKLVMYENLQLLRQQPSTYEHLYFCLFHLNFD